MQIPGKEEFAETLRYYRRRFEVLGVEVRLGTRADASRRWRRTTTWSSPPAWRRGSRSWKGSGHPKVVSYAEVLDGSVVPGRRVAVIGAGGIGVDVAHFLTHSPETTEEWLAHWGVADPAVHRGGLTDKLPRTPAREVYLLQRKTTPIGKDLGKTSGWAHRLVLKDSGVRQLNGVTYDRVDDEGLHLTVDGSPQVLDVDHVVVCAGQESVRGLYDDLVSAGRGGAVHLIGGADVAAELDAKRAIKQGTEVAARL